MCGIAGILRLHRPNKPVPPHSEAIPENWLDILDDSLKHRGPDDAGRFRDRAFRPDGTVVDVALVHRRLSIIDLAGGWQPMVHVRHPDGSSELLKPDSFRAPRASEEVGQRAPTVGEGSDSSRVPNETPPSRSGLVEPSSEFAAPPTIDATGLPPETDLIAVVFNGCIYNQRELRAELEALGHRFETDHSDTEVLVHGWRAWGTEILWKLDGMCAATWWDRRRAAMCSVRTRYGEKPLYEFVDDTGGTTNATYAVSSAVPGLLSVRQRLGLGSIPERSRTSRWLAMGWGTLATPVQDLNEIGAPGLHIAPLGLKNSPGLVVAPAGRLRPSGDPVPFRTADEVDQQLAHAVASRLEADVPLGCFLSGGIDSALVAHYARSRLGDLHTFTVRMPDARYDESEAAYRSSQHLGTTHHTLDCEARPAEDLVHLIHQLGLPLGDSSLLPTFWVARAARRFVKVVLTGDGGDEMFCGYERHTIDRTLQIMRHAMLPMRLTAALIPGNVHPRSKFAKGLRLVSAAGYRGYDDLVAIFPTPLWRALVGTSVSRRRGESQHELHGRDYDAERYLPGDLMRKADTATMAVALEARNPFLETELSRRALATPLSVLMPNGERKGLLKQVARKYLPPDIVERPKQGFAIPIGEWFRNDFGRMRQLLFDHLESADPFPGLADTGVAINMDFVRRMLREHDAAGQKSLNPWRGRDHSQRLYALLVLSIWARWLDRVRHEGHDGPRSP